MDPRDPAARELLAHGRLEVRGRMVDASNATLLCMVSCDGLSVACVYKPVRGERPLWDFPDGTLADREVATYLVSEAIGWSIVPPTLLRPGPFGPGMVQLWVDTVPGADLVDVVAPADVPEGWRIVLRAHDRLGDPAVLVHADRPELRRMAVFDVVVNNADRKGGHVLSGVEGGVYGVDHGVCLHHEEKLRTVLWGWVGEPLAPDVLEALRTLRGELGSERGLDATLSAHLTRKERGALCARVDRLLALRQHPAPSSHWPAIPWPAF